MKPRLLALLALLHSSDALPLFSFASCIEFHQFYCSCCHCPDWTQPFVFFKFLQCKNKQIISNTHFPMVFFNPNLKFFVEATTEPVVRWQLLFINETSSISLSLLPLTLRLDLRLDPGQSALLVYPGVKPLIVQAHIQLITKIMVNKQISKFVQVSWFYNINW